MRIKSFTTTEREQIQKKVQKILGKEFTLVPYELDRTFGGIEFVNNNLYLIGSTTLKKLLALNIPFNVGRLGDQRFHVILYMKHKKSSPK